MNDDPSVKITDFLQGLPDTIRDNICSIILTLINIEDTNNSQISELETLKRLLNPELPAWPLGYAICIIAAIDYILPTLLENDRVGKDMLTTVAERSPRFAPEILGLSICNRHLQQAEVRWNELRSGGLSYVALRDAFGVPTGLRPPTSPEAKNGPIVQASIAEDRQPAASLDWLDAYRRHLDKYYRPPGGY